jgi:hypothetical protein
VGNPEASALELSDVSGESMTVLRELSRGSDGQAIDIAVRFIIDHAIDWLSDDELQVLVGKALSSSSSITRGLSTLLKWSSPGSTFRGAARRVLADFLAVWLGEGAGRPRVTRLT